MNPLFYYNTTHEPLSVGDVFVFCYYLEIQRKKKGERSFSFYFVVEDKPHDDLNFRYLSEYNKNKWLLSLLEIPKLFSSCLDVGIIKKENTGSNHYTFFEKWGEIENHLVFSVDFLDSNTLISKKIRCDFGEKYITVNLRNNKNNSVDRNSDVLKWRELFLNYPSIPFVFVGDRAKNFTDLIDIKNIFFVKDIYDTSLSDDLLIINDAYLHIGASSGPNTGRLLQNQRCLSEKQAILLNYKLIENDGVYNFVGRENFKFWPDNNINKMSEQLEMLL